MKDETKIPEKTYPVPMDMLMDVLKVILKNGLSNCITGISAPDNQIQLNVKFPPHNRFAKDAMENIEAMLTEYGFYLTGSPEEQTLFGDDPTNGDKYF